MTLAWLQLSFRQTEAYSTETAVAFITAKIVASLRFLAVAEKLGHASTCRKVFCALNGTISAHGSLTSTLIANIMLLI